MTFEGYSRLSETLTYCSNTIKSIVKILYLSGIPIILDFLELNRVQKFRRAAGGGVITPRGAPNCRTDIHRRNNQTYTTADICL